ncbi:CadC family transcriptional regulator [Serratia marcescens]|uniref:transcriptional regulator n=1 Tax=Serratia marcescens TaxID=615 RepID=UPI0011526581|nr:winged helix-turn-helix domain-containing protein [Serratia marcescens]QDI21348.1 CadC family transcriptional regulator [Serratia marcescens]QDI31092.1 CadC family transcriptional regulator [Serratia marcescens]QDI45589.1 CadC family transcriptional regulator [Serratia marcescens]QDI60018.1 CadC family transcriptional regulator [Serratia marcescens]QLJ67567.1 winged helix-turn-helix domain-containing protein [Serratia marcescens]
MIFVINKKVKYNEYEGTLESIDDPGNPVVLVKPACRLLSIFVRNNDMLIKRKQLLDEVWEEHGLKATDSNLNNYIFGLRKMLAQFELSDLIITYPRQGFKFVAENVTRKEVDSDMQETTLVIERVEKSNKQEDKPSVPEQQGTISNKITLLSKMLIVCVCLLMAFLMLASYKQLPVTSLTNLGQYKNCDIYSIKYNGMKQHEVDNEIAQRYRCEERANIYYYFNIKEKVKPTYTSLIAYCPLAISASCEISYLTD